MQPWLNFNHSQLLSCTKDARDHKHKGIIKFTLRCNLVPKGHAKIIHKNFIHFIKILENEISNTNTSKKQKN